MSLMCLRVADGQLGEIWFDGGYGGDVGPAIKKLIQPQKLAVGFGGAGVIDSPVGWVGTVRKQS